jgi:hypothetical protein
MGCIVVEHLHGFQGIFVQVLPHQTHLLQNIRRDRDDMAADFIGLENVQEFPRTGPAEITNPECCR